MRFPYALFGPELERKIVIFEKGDVPRIEERLHASDPVYLVVQGDGAFDRWARRRPLEYKPVFAQDGVRVFKQERAVKS